MIQTVSELNHSHQGQRVRLLFLDGEVAEVDIIEVALPNKYDKTPESWGVIYDLISSNRPPSAAAKESVFWSQLNEIKSFEVLGKATP